MHKTTQMLAAALVLFLIPSAALAEGFGLGWQHTGPASGLSLKLPLDRYLVIQPMLSLSVKDQPDGALGHTSYGLRTIMRLPSLGSLHPYTGVGAGRSTRYEDGERLVNQGFQGFVGLEIDFNGFRPSVEMALGRVGRSDGTGFTGTMYNFGLHYYF